MSTPVVRFHYSKVRFFETYFRVLPTFRIFRYFPGEAENIPVFKRKYKTEEEAIGAAQGLNSALMEKRNKAMNAEQETLASNKEAIDAKINRIIFVARVIKRNVKANKIGNNYTIGEGLLDELHALNKLLARNSYLVLVEEQ